MPRCAKLSISLIFAMMVLVEIADAKQAARPGDGVIEDTCGTGISDHELAGCAEDAAERADRKLRRAYRHLQSQLDDQISKAALAKSQRAWKRFRDAECNYQSGSVANGVMMRFFLAACDEHLAKQRTAALRDDLPE